MYRITVFLLAFAYALPSWSAPAGYEATYDLKAGPLTVGEMQRTFTVHEDGTYEFVSKIRTTGLASIMRRDELVETSTGSFRDGVYYPVTYRYDRKNKRKPRHVHTSFDRENAMIETRYNERESATPLADGVLDNLVYQAALMSDLAAGRTNLRYDVTDRGKHKVYEPVVGERTTIETAIGSFETIPVIRQSPGDERRTIFWCAEALGYLPVRVAHRDKDGDETIVTITHFRQY